MCYFSLEWSESYFRKIINIDLIQCEKPSIVIKGPFNYIYFSATK